MRSKRLYLIVNSRKDGFRLIYMVSKTEEFVAFLDIYPKNGPLQKLEIHKEELKFLIQQFLEEAGTGVLQDYVM